MEKFSRQRGWSECQTPEHFKRVVEQKMRLNLHSKIYRVKLTVREFILKLFQITLVPPSNVLK